MARQDYDFDSYLGPEKREEQRLNSPIQFKCFHQGKKIEVSAINRSARGAFIQMNKVVKPGTAVILEPARREYLGRPPHLVARVIHFQLSPKMGVGVKFEFAISPEGLDELDRFLTQYVGINLPEEEKERFRAASDKEIVYNFSTQRLGLSKTTLGRRESKTVSLYGIRVKEDMLQRLGLSEVKVVYTEAPKQKRVSLSEDVSMVSRADMTEDPLEEAKQLEEWLRIRKSRKEVSEPGQVSYEGLQVDVTVVGVDMRGIAVESEKLLPGEGKRVILNFNIPSPDRQAPVSIICEIRKVIRNRKAGKIGADLKILTLREGDNPGIYKKWVKSKA